MYKVYIKVSYIELCFRFDDSGSAVNFMMKAIRNFDAKETNERTIEVTMKIDPELAEQEDDF